MLISIKAKQNQKAQIQDPLPQALFKQHPNISTTVSMTESPPAGMFKPTLSQERIGILNPGEDPELKGSLI